MAALWCWWQQLRDSQTWNLLHVDRHYDALASQLELWLEKTPREASSLTEYLDAKYDAPGLDGAPVMRWDNYLSLFLALHSDRVRYLYTATSEGGDRPDHASLEELNPWQLTDLMETLAAGDGYLHEDPWIMNIDLDYFTFEESRENKTRMFDDAFVAGLGVWARMSIERGLVKCLTIALSPETTRDWDTAVDLMRTFMKEFDEFPEV